MKIHHFLCEDDDLDEKFTSDENRHSHYQKHIVKEKNYDWTEEEYEQKAEELAKTPCDYKRIFGYIAKDKEAKEGKQLRYIKYDKETELFTSYYYRGNEPLTITAFKRSWRDFDSKRYDANERFEYVDEIPPGK